MAVILNLKPEMEEKVARKAAVEGTTISTYLEKIAEKLVEPEPSISRTQTQFEKNQAALAVLRQWDEEDATDDPEEIARRQAEWEEFKKGMNAAHSSNRIIYP